jgi:hypothetical protein
MYHLTPIFYILLVETSEFSPFGLRRFPVWRGCSNLNDDQVAASLSVGTLLEEIVWQTKDRH